MTHAETTLPEQRTDANLAEREKKTAPTEQIDTLKKDMRQEQEKSWKD